MFTHYVIQILPAKITFYHNTSVSCRDTGYTGRYKVLFPNYSANQNQNFYTCCIPLVSKITQEENTHMAAGTVLTPFVKMSCFYQGIKINGNAFYPGTKLWIGAVVPPNRFHLNPSNTQDFSDGSACQPQRGGANLLFSQLFPKKCMKF